MVAKYSSERLLFLYVRGPEAENLMADAGRRMVKEQNMIPTVGHRNTSESKVQSMMNTDTKCVSIAVTTKHIKKQLWSIN